VARFLGLTFLVGCSRRPGAWARGVLAPYTIGLDRFAGDSAGLASLRAAAKSLGILSREGIHRRQEHATGPRARPSMFAQMAGSLEGHPTPLQENCDRGVGEDMVVTISRRRSPLVSLVGISPPLREVEVVPIGCLHARTPENSTFYIYDL
jgi:hypothetical protein